MDTQRFIGSQAKLGLLTGLLSLLTILGACAPPTVPTQSNKSYSSLSRFKLQSSGKPGPGKLVTSTKGDVYINDVPFVKQGQDNTCGQAVATMVLKYWGHDIDYQTVVNESNPMNLGTSYDSLQSYLRHKGLYAQGYREGSLELLVELIKLGRPVIALLDFGGLNWEHYVLVVGYNARRNTLILHESNSIAYAELDAETFVERWRNPSLVNLPLFGGSSYDRLMFDVGLESAVEADSETSS